MVPERPFPRIALFFRKQPQRKKARSTLVRNSLPLVRARGTLTCKRLGLYRHKNIFGQLLFDWMHHSFKAFDALQNIPTSNPKAINNFVTSKRTPVVRFARCAMHIARVSCD